MKMLVVVLFLGIVGISKGKAPSDSVFVRKSLFGYKFFHHNTRINFNQLPTILNENQEALQIIKKAKTKNTVASIFSGLGCFVIGVELGIAIAGGEPNWNATALGGGLILISIPISSKSYNQAMQAISTYNTDLATSSKRPQLFLCATGEGFGLKLKF